MSDAVRFGTIKHYSERGFGFVVSEDGQDRFFHISEFVADDEPTKGERVSFIEEVGRDGRPRARQVMRRLNKERP